MSEYIGCRSCPSPSCKGCNINTLAKMLDNGAFKRITDDYNCIIPVTDVEEVKCGRWKSVGLSSFKCSKCGYVDDWKMEYRYCPDCGAYMRDGGKDNG